MKVVISLWTSFLSNGCAASECASLCGEVPEHLDQGVWEGVQVDVEFAHC